MLVVKVIDVLLDLETVVRDRLAALAERFLEERARCRVDIGPQAELLPSDPAAHRMLGAIFSSRRVDAPFLPQAVGQGVTADFADIARRGAIEDLYERPGSHLIKRYRTGESRVGTGCARECRTQRLPFP